MKKKFFITLLSLVSVLCLSLPLAACGELNDDADERGEDGHMHEYTEWTVTKEATCLEEGSRERTCTVCDYIQTEVIEKTDHDYNSENICKVCGYELEFTTGLAYEEYAIDERSPNNTYYMVTGMGTATDKDLVIPAYHAGKSVKKIADSAFIGKDALTSVYVANGVERIGDKAFAYCSSLKKVVLPESIGDSYLEWDQNAVTQRICNIGESAFYSCTKLTDIKMPSASALIGANAFLSTAYYNNANNWENGILYVGNHLVATNDNFTATSYTAKETVVSIADKAFYGKTNLTEFVIPSSNALYNIGSNALSGTSINKATVSTLFLELLPRNNLIELTVTGSNYLHNYYGKYLSECVNLESLTFDCRLCLGKYGSYPLKGLGKLKNLTVKSLQDYELKINYVSGAPITLLYLFGTSEFDGAMPVSYYNSGRKKIEYYAPASLRTVTVMEGTIAEYAFAGCSMLTEITYGKDVTDYGIGSVLNCNDDLTINCLGGIDCMMQGANSGYNIVSNFYAIGSENKFAEIKINGNPLSESIELPDGIESIPDYAFYGFASVKNIQIPDSVTSIGKNAFSQCLSLTAITVGENNPYYTDNDGILYNKAETEIIHVPLNISGSIMIPNSVTSIGDSAFYNRDLITSIVIPDSVTSIGDWAFRNCTSLTSITIGKGVESIGSYAFYKCTALTSITIPDSVTSIGSYAFESCTSLTSITLPDSVTSIGSFAFSSCSSLTSITIPDSVTSIGSYAFMGCTSLTSITIPDSVTSIEYYAFESCSSLTSITIPDSVTSIGSYAFYKCTSLTSITIPDSVTSIEYYAFRNCTSLTSITFHGTMEQWNDVTKSASWASNTGDFTVICTDGKLDKNGNEI